MQVNVDIRVVVQRPEPLGANLQFDSEFFPSLAPESFLVRLVRFDLAAWELPEQAAGLAWRALLDQDSLAPVTGDERCHHPQTAGGNTHPEPRGGFISNE
jgi:hypothetical protein